MWVNAIAQGEVGSGTGKGPGLLTRNCNFGSRMEEGKLSMEPGRSSQQKRNQESISQRPRDKNWLGCRL